MNDMPDVVKQYCKIFADDTKIYAPVKNTADQQKLQEDLSNLCEWSKKWLMEFNIGKCKTIQYGNVKIPHEYEMVDKCNNVQKLPQDGEEKDLGITFEKTLTFNSHIINTVNKANRIIGLIKRSFSHMDKQMFVSIYKALVRSILDYGSPVWNPTTKKDTID